MFFPARYESLKVKWPAFKRAATIPAKYNIADLEDQEIATNQLPSWFWPHNKHRKTLAKNAKHVRGVTKVNFDHVRSAASDLH